ncbi:MAG: todS 2 [Planctomycetaceae bacterium]|nr:todS 2 [Planctomycetaceae bacterium]
MLEVTPLRILVIEDDEDTRANLQDILELDDHHVIAVSSVKEALAHTELMLTSVIVLDRRLPDGNAEDLIPQLKRSLPYADIIVVTGHADVESAILALQRGAADYILKPINPDILRASLARTAKQIALRSAKERSEANFRELIEAVDFMVVILGQDHKITYSNRFATELTGYSPAELLGQSSSMFLERDSQSRVETQLQRLRHGQRALEQEILIRCRNGEERWILWNVRFLKDFEGSHALISVGHDVTERRRLEHRAMQAERLAAIGQMVTGLAHESRNALQRSQACLESLIDELDGQPEALELVARIQRAQHHLHHLYEEVRGYAAPIVLRREMCPINRVWQDTWANLEVARCKKRLTLREEVDPDNLECSVDPLALEQVFRNIFENAIHVSREGDELLVKCCETTFRGRPALETTICDQGPGLKPEQAARIFEPFYTTKTQGTGLGMAIVKRIVEAHGGHIEVRQRNCPGAEIVVILPRTDE